jgi:hypothetical protein
MAVERQILTVVSKDGNVLQLETEAGEKWSLDLDTAVEFEVGDQFTWDGTTLHILQAKRVKEDFVN